MADHTQTDTQGTDNERIIRRIQKLLTMGEHGKGSEDEHTRAEAMASLAKAQTLLAEHNLNYAMVMSQVVAGGTVEAAPEKREKTRMGRAAKYKWQRELWAALAKTNFCWWWIVEVYEGKRNTSSTTSKVPVKRHMILGRESNVLVVRMMGEYLEDTMERILPYPNRERLSRAAISWKAGCAEELVERMEEQAERMRKQSEKARAKAGAGSMALSLRDVNQFEYEMNYDARYGLGSFRRKLLRDEEWEKGAEERERKAKEEEAEEERKYLEYLQSLSPEQRKAREREEAAERRRQERNEARRNARWDRGYWGRQSAGEADKTDHRAKQAGREAGKSISLAVQVTDGRKNDTKRLGA